MSDDISRPTVAAISPPLARGLLTRRTFAKASLGVGTIAALSACGAKGTRMKPQFGPDKSATDKIVNWSNWPEYIDVDDKTQARPSLDIFTKQTSIKCNYTEDVNDNDEFYAKVQPFLSKGADCGRDTFCVTDWMAARMIRFGWVLPFDKDNMPNWKNLDPTLLNVSWDPGRVSSIPWQSGFTGIAYNPKSTNGMKIETIDQLLKEPSIKGKVTLLTEMRDTVGLTMLSMGIDPADFNDDDFDAAIAKLQSAVDSGQIAGFTGNDYGKSLASGDTAACMAWTGDVVQLKADNPNLGYVLPASGHMAWSDNFLIPNLAQHKTNAEKLINYYYTPVAAAMVEDYVNYISPVMGAKEILLKEDPAVAENPLIFPSDEVRAKSHIFRGLSTAEENAYNTSFQALIGG